MEKQKSSQTINNSFYDSLHDDWYSACDHPVALLRRENAFRIPWIAQQIGENKIVLDIGCGGGFLTNSLAKKGHTVFGIDQSETSIQTAHKHDETKTVQYQVANAYSLPFPSHQFDVVCAMDILEHVENPSLLIKEASRVLKPGGRFFFHTFNRNFLTYLLIIKGVEWFVVNTPPNMHVYSLFIKPKELKTLCLENELEIIEMKGFVPKWLSAPFFKMLFTKKVSNNFGFTFSKSLATGYCGYAKKIG